MQFDILGASIAMNIALVAGLGWHWIKLRRLKQQLCEAVADITHEVVCRAATTLRCAICVRPTPDKQWEAHSSTLSVCATTPVAAAIELLAKGLKQK